VLTTFRAESIGERFLKGVADERRRTICVSSPRVSELRRACHLNVRQVAGRRVLDKQRPAKLADTAAADRKK